MIVRPPLTGLQLFLALQGSILPRIASTVLINTLLAVGITVVHHYWPHLSPAVSPLPFTLLGLPLAIFMAFRNNTAYDRFWEARKQWGEIVHRTRSLARQCLGLVAGPVPARADDLQDPRVRMMRRAIAFVHALRLQLRGLQDDALVARWLPADDVAKVLRKRNLSDAVMLEMGRELGGMVRERRIDERLAANIDGTLSALAGSAAACERIRNTPTPFSYTLLLHRTAYLYCFLLPFGLVDSLGMATPAVVALVAYTFFGLDALGDEIEEPFGLENNDLPLDALCRAIEINVLDAFDAEDLPPSLAPIDHRLT